MKKALIIINRSASMGKKAPLEEALTRNLISQNYEPVIKYTEPTGFEHIILEHSLDTNRIVSSGGDRTISELVSILGKENINIPVAAIPTGTVNDFSRANNIPLNPITTAKELDTTNTKTIDTIKINNTYAGAKLDDGLLHILNIERINIEDIVMLIYMAFTRNITKHPKVMYSTTEQVEIKTRDFKEMNIVGDLYDYKDVKVSVFKDGLELIKNPMID